MTPRPHITITTMYGTICTMGLMENGMVSSVEIIRFSTTPAEVEIITIMLGMSGFLDTVDANGCKTQKIVAHSGISEFFSIGMSGKWLMCYTGKQVYRIDTTNVANIELVSGITYNSSNLVTYIVDDDVVINGWYFLDGVPKLYLRETPEASYVGWGRSQFARYKTYAIREWM